jgi:hypothetical protein
MSKDHTSFLGVPVTGKVQRGRSRKEQRSIEELRPLLEAVLADPFIVAIGWEQYTPYFNDGDVCEFRAREPWVKTIADTDPDKGRWDLTMYSHPTFSGSMTAEVQASMRRADAFCMAVEDGEFENVLLDAFGDHAKVEVRKDGISVEFYEHE